MHMGTFRMGSPPEDFTGITTSVTAQRKRHKSLIALCYVCIRSRT